MIEIKISCPECGKTGDHGQVQLDIQSGNMRVECGWCHVTWIMGTPLLGSPIVEGNAGAENMPYWKKKALGMV